MREDGNNVTIDLGRIFYRLLKELPAIIAAAISCALVGLLISAFLIPPTYSASAQMLVNNRGDDQGQSAISQSDINASNSLVDTYAIILKSHDVLDKIVKECHLDYSSEELSDMISVKAVNSTQVMRITVENGDSQEALKICQTLVNLAPDAIITAIDAGSVSTISTPYTTGKPISPSKSRFTLIGGLLGLFLAAIYVIIRELTNDKFKTPEDIRQVLDIPLLGVIPEENIGKNAKQKKGRRKGGSKNGKEKE